MTALALLCACIPVAAFGSNEGGHYLSSEELRKLAPAYETFLKQLADTIVDKGLISPEEREDWLMYQMGDFYQNGGSGEISTLFYPGLLSDAQPQDKLLRLEKTFSAGTLLVDTMRAYSPLDATLPGLMLEASLSDEDGLPVRCLFRWSCDQGGLSTWDAMGGKVAEVGVSYVNDGRPIYWSDQPVTDDSTNNLWHVTVEVLAPEDSRLLGTATITLKPSGSGWALDEQAMR